MVSAFELDQGAANHCQPAAKGNDAKRGGRTAGHQPSSRIKASGRLGLGDVRRRRKRVAYHSARLRRPSDRQAMTAPRIVSTEFLLWTQIVLLWSVVSYGIAADPLREEAQRFRWRRWLLPL